MKSKDVILNAEMMAAIKELLFSAHREGCDMTPIVDDLLEEDDNRDEVAVRVLLAYKGVVPEPKDKVRFSVCPKKDKPVAFRFDFKRQSVILNNVTVEMTVAKIAKDGSVGPFMDPRLRTIPGAMWDILDTELPDKEDILDMMKDRSE